MDEAVTRVLKICNKRGLHARASARFVECVERYDAQFQVSKDGQNVEGSSIMGLMMLGASEGSEISVSACGTDAVEGIEAVAKLVRERFGEEE